MEEREDIKPFETICNNHNQIIWMLKEFKRTGDMWYVDQSIKLARHCKKQGQSMENRLTLLKNGIEKMGFQRTYKVPKGKELKSWQKES
jgi:hypothetical protein